MRKFLLLPFILAACSGPFERGLQSPFDPGFIVGGAEVPPDDIITRQALSFRSYYAPDIKVTEKDGKTTTTTHYQVLQCTASAITPRIALTAAHCIHPEAVVQRLELRSQTGALIYRDVVATSAHPQYSDENKLPDLALLLLSEDLPEEIEILALPEKELDLKLSTITAAGYGRISGIPDAKVKGTGVLRTTTLNVTKYSPSEPVFSVDQSQGKGICQGDSGGPAIIEISGNTYVVGVAARVFFNDQVPKEELNFCNSRAEYVNIQHELDWIKETVGILAE